MSGSGAASQEAKVAAVVEPVPTRTVHRLQGGGLLAVAAAIWIATRRQRSRGAGQWASVGVSWLLVQAAFQALKSEVLGFFKRLAAKTESDLDDRLLSLVERELQSRWTLAVISYVALRYGPPPPVEWMRQYEGPLSQVDWLARGAVACALALRGSALVTDSAKAAVETSVAPQDRPAAKPFIGFTRAACITLSGLFVGSSLGLHVQNLLAGLGIGGVAMAMGVQSFVQDFFGAASLLVVSRPFYVGSCISINGVWGTVESIGLNSTRLRDNAGTLHIIPNATVSTSEVTIGDPGWNYGTVNIEVSAKTSPLQLKAFADLVKNVIESSAGPTTTRCELYSCNLKRLTEWGFDWEIVFEVKDEHAAVTSEKVDELAGMLRLGIVEAIAPLGISLASTARLELMERCGRLPP